MTSVATTVAGEGREAGGGGASWCEAGSGSAYTEFETTITSVNNEKGPLSLRSFLSSFRSWLLDLAAQRMPETCALAVLLALRFTARRARHPKCLRAWPCSPSGPGRVVLGLLSWIQGKGARELASEGRRHACDAAFSSAATFRQSSFSRSHQEPLLGESTHPFCSSPAPMRSSRLCVTRPAHAISGCASACGRVAPKRVA